MHLPSSKDARKSTTTNSTKKPVADSEKLTTGLVPSSDDQNEPAEDSTGKSKAYTSDACASIPGVNIS